MACEACNAKFSFFTRKKQCTDCLRYFCSECVIKRLDKVSSCDSCSVLSRRPMARTLIAQMRSKDLRQYLLGKKVPVKGCIEKEDLIKLLLSYANGPSDYCNAQYTQNPQNPQNRDDSSGDRSESESYRADAHPSHPSHPSTRTDEVDEAVEAVETDAPRIDRDEISRTVARAELCTDGLHCVTDPVKLADINELSDLEHLSVKQLKNLLATNRVNYKGCVEKCELLSRACRLWEEYKHSRTKMEVADEDACKICWEEPVECVILECGHMACCLKCGKQMSECPICKQYVVRVVRVFKA